MLLPRRGPLRRTFHPDAQANGRPTFCTLSLPACADHHQATGNCIRHRQRCHKLALRIARRRKMAVATCRWCFGLHCGCLYRPAMAPTSVMATSSLLNSRARTIGVLHSCRTRISTGVRSSITTRDGDGHRPVDLPTSVSPRVRRPFPWGPSVDRTRALLRFSPSGSGCPCPSGGTPRKPSPLA